MKKKDWILIGVILLLAVVLLALYYLTMLIREEKLQKYDNVYVVVELNGEEIERYNLTDEGVYKLNGGTNTLCIEDGKAYLIDAKCPDKSCVNMGNVGVLNPIVCLPNKLTVTLHGEH